MITKHLSLDSKYVSLAGKRLSFDDTKYFYNVNLIQSVGDTFRAFNNDVTVTANFITKQDK